ncbi:Glycosylphosphatidylinositol specific phospholipase D1 [Mortierella sp. AD010]|nr:Glycosylphosphatidylinositol specific phospholipase D1 [Mortierella sp. AD010]
MRGPSILFSALALTLVALDSTVQGCGVTIHNEIAFRANLKGGIYDYIPLLEQKGALYAGSFFPDWGYNCIGKIYNNAAEEAHWPQFAEAAIKYIHETYAQPWEDHTKELITFLFGTVSHSLGDMSWHALWGLNSGFIRAIANTSFAGDYSKGHTLADIGAEFVLSHMAKMDHLVTSWRVPVKDISQIYKRMGYTVPGPVLSHCMRNGYAGAQANARLGSQLFPVYASKSPFLAEQLEDYPMGGLRDMSEWTVDCWNGLAEYLNKERKLPNDEDRRANRTINLCYALWEERIMKHHHDAMERTRNGEVRHQHESNAVSEGAFALTRLDLAGLQVRSDFDDHTGMVTFSIEENEPARSKRVNAETSFRVEDGEDKRQQPPLDDERNHNRFWDFTDFNLQQKLDWNSHTLEAGLSLKKLAHKNRSGACISFSDELKSQARTLFLPIEYSSFGHAAVMGDFDGDGNLELAVSAPHMRIDPLMPSQGAVFVIHSDSLFVDQIDNDDFGTDVRSIASRTLYGDPSELQSRFGWSLAVVDLNQDGIDDLAIGAPGHGAKDLKYDGSVFVYFGHAGTGLSEKPDLVLYHNRTKDEIDKVPRGMNSLAGLGYVLQGLDVTGSGYKDLVIGMPMATTPIKPVPAETPEGTLEETPEDKSDDVEDLVPKRRKKWKPPKFRAQAGKVLVFLSSAGHKGQKLDTESDWELQGEDEYGWFGSSFAVISQAQQSRETSTSTWSLSSLLSWMNPSRSRNQCGCCHSKGEANERRILVVGSPTFGVGEKEAMRGKIQGFVIPDFKSKKRPTETQKVFTIHGDTKSQQLGSSLALNRVSPEEFGEPQDFLVVGSQSEDVLNHLPRVGRQWQAGTVRILDTSMLADGAEVKISDLDANIDIVRDLLQGSQSMAHLSAAMRVSTDGKSLWLTEPYANAEAGRILEWVPNLEKRDNDGNRGRRTGRSRRRRMSPRRNVLGVRGRRLVHGDYLQDGGDGDDDDDTAQDDIKQCFIGSDFRGRFGSHLIVADLFKDGLDDIVVTSSHASQYANMAGIVTIKFRS